MHLFAGLEHDRQVGRVVVDPLVLGDLLSGAYLLVELGVGVGFLREVDDLVLVAVVLAEELGDLGQLVAVDRLDEALARHGHRDDARTDVGEVQVVHVVLVALLVARDHLPDLVHRYYSN